MKFTRETEVRAVVAKSTTEQFVWDDGMPGFGVRCRDGRGRYVIQFRVNGKQRRMTLGNIAKVTLADARKIAHKHFGTVAHDVDPTIARQAAKAAASQAFGDLIDDFLEYQREKGISASWLQATERALRRRFKCLHKLPVDLIDRAVIAKALDGIKQHGKVAHDRDRSSLSAFFTWAVGKGRCKLINPVDGTLTASGPYKKRKRYLSKDEIRKVWNALDDYTNFGRVVKLLMLTGLRRCEIGDLVWAEVDFDNAVINLSEERNKNKEASVTPLSAPALAILKSCRRRKESESMLGNKAGFTDWYKSKRDLDAIVKIPHWTLHDLRRTCKTHMLEELDIPPHITEAILNHISGADSAHHGIAGKYSAAQFVRKKREALDLWADFIAKIVGPPSRKLRLVA